MTYMFSFYTFILNEFQTFTLSEYNGHLLRIADQVSATKSVSYTEVSLYIQVYLFGGKAFKGTFILYSLTKNETSLYNIS